MAIPGGGEFGVMAGGGGWNLDCAAPEQVIDRLWRDVAAFHGGTSQADDTTALEIRCVS